MVSRYSAFINNINFNGANDGCCWFIWNFSTRNVKKMNIDPAIASSVFVTTITDVIGFVSFLGVGAYFL